jgi:glycerol-3-phosphate acyltransferase PlsY
MEKLGNSSKIIKRGLIVILVFLTIGVFVAVKSAGSCVDAPICNLVFDLTGSYIPIYIAFGVMMVIVTVLFQLVITSAYKDKKLLEAKAE